MANTKEVQDIKQAIELGKCFEVALLDLCKRNGESSSKLFDPIIWEICQSLDYSTAAIILNLFAGKTVKFPDHKQVQIAIYRAAALADKDKGMSDSDIVAKYTSMVGSTVIKDIAELDCMRKLGGQWLALYGKLERTYSGKDME
jgi:hypothetical protein